VRVRLGVTLPGETIEHITHRNVAFLIRLERPRTITGRWVSTIDQLLFVMFIVCGLLSLPSVTSNCWVRSRNSRPSSRRDRGVHSIFPLFAAVPMVHLLESGEALKSALSTETGGEANYP
jgi:hypothetical protein